MFIKKEIYNNFDFKCLKDTDFKESAVREELINPLIKKLGYKANGINKIVYDKGLQHPFVKVGSKKRKIIIVPDYLFEVNGIYAWVLDAKAPREIIKEGEHLEQIYFYAIHPDIRADIYALCNGEEFIAFEKDRNEPVLYFKLKDINLHWSKFEKYLNPDYFNSKRKLLKEVSHLNAMLASQILENKKKSIKTKSENVKKYNERKLLIHKVIPNQLYVKPHLDLLSEDLKNNYYSDSVSNEELIETKNTIVESLSKINIKLTKIKATIGHTVILYEVIAVDLTPKIKKREKELINYIRPNKTRIMYDFRDGHIFIEVMNNRCSRFNIKKLYSYNNFLNSKIKLPIVLGLSATNKIISYDLTTYKNILILGDDDYIKTNIVNLITLSLLFKIKPSELKFFIIDFNRIDFIDFHEINKIFFINNFDNTEISIYNFVDAYEYLISLKDEFNKRIELFRQKYCKNITEYNKKEQSNKLPNILCFINGITDEFIRQKKYRTLLLELLEISFRVGIYFVINIRNYVDYKIINKFKDFISLQIITKINSSDRAEKLKMEEDVINLREEKEFFTIIQNKKERVTFPEISTDEIHKVCNFINNQFE